ncbi:hypothetical protein GRADUATION_80 [Mycobacterium phage Graduation]|uniref:hypothetical protein n=1 Tax=Mycobacterium phage Graduation TaxID=1391432 RepID=UPI0003C93932|nr:hypothetical protein GRADUATION_80 [Mycobacterium phage Graduation]AHB29776.1 hypothetical protein GRADUATION_80 [Mycobacterium phage Graduation]
MTDAQRLIASILRSNAPDAASCDCPTCTAVWADGVAEKLWRQLQELKSAESND